MKAFLFLSLSLVTLVSCASTQTFANRCQQYGFKPGTTEFATCVQGEQQAYSRALMNMGQQISAPPPTPSRISCRKNIMGGFDCTQ